MKLLVTRTVAYKDRDGLMGEMWVNGEPHYSTMERLSEAIPAGVYTVTVTVSNRATLGQLWSPDSQHRLPLINAVPNRSGIRIHAANAPHELEGCVAVGMIRTNAILSESRVALSRLMALLLALPLGEAVELTVQDISPQAGPAPSPTGV